jgi:hypothetical protein
MLFSSSTDTAPLAPIAYLGHNSATNQVETSPSTQYVLRIARHPLHNEVSI